MAYNNTHHKIYNIWNLSNQNEQELSNKKIESNENLNSQKNIFQYNSKKIYTIESEWELMDYVVAGYEYHPMGGIGKNYEIIIKNLPIYLLPYIKYSLFYKNDNPDIIVSYIFHSDEIFYLVHGVSNEEDITKVIKDVTIYIPFQLRGTYLTDSKTSTVYSRLILKIFNPGVMGGSKPTKMTYNFNQNYIGGG
jgi:hypothetical protein